MKKILYLLAIMFILGLVGCSFLEPPKPQDTVRRFVEKTNALDVDGMLDCIDPPVAKGARSVMNVVGWATGAPVKDIISMFPLLKLGIGDISRIEIISMTDRRVFDARVEVAAQIRQVLRDPQTGQTKTTNGVVSFPMKLVDGKWYIATE
jgi:hypothetical protein